MGVVKGTLEGGVGPSGNLACVLGVLVECAEKGSAWDLVVSCGCFVVAEASVVGTEHTVSQAIVPELTFITHATLYNPGLTNSDFGGATKLAGTKGTVWVAVTKP